MGMTALFSRHTPGGVFTIQNLEDHPRAVWFVDSAIGTDSTGNGASPDSPFATVAYAAASALLGVGDVVYIMPGHAETIAAAAGIACSVAGVRFIGLGWGSKKPTFTWSATTSTWTITAANVTIKNIRTTSTIAAVVKLFSSTAAFTTLDGVDYYEDGTTDALQFLLTTAAATDPQVINCRWYRGTTAASALCQWIVLTGADRAIIKNNFGILKGFTTSNPINSFIAVVTTACVGVEIADNRFYDSNSTGNSAILMLSGTTGMINNNRVGTSQATLASSIVGASCFMMENYCTNEVAKGGVLEPAADAA